MTNNNNDFSVARLMFLSLEQSICDEIPITFIKYHIWFEPEHTVEPYMLYSAIMETFDA